MRLLVAAIGKLRAGPEKALIDDYQTRASAIGRNLGFTAFDIQEFEAPAKLSGGKRQDAEAKALLNSTPDGAFVIALDERGRNYSSEELAKLLARQRDEGASAAAFVIGGADGHGPAVKQKANLTLSFGAATWPHLLVRVMLLEQLYRAMTIIAGHPYHRS